MKIYIYVFLMMILALGIHATPALAEGETSNSGDVQQKLNHVMEAQTEILKQLAEIKEELQIIKVRSSR